MLPPLFLAASLMLTGCTDSDYDFDNIDSTVGIGGSGLEIPASSTEDIKLSDVLELEANGSVVEADNGDYVFRQTGSQVQPVHPLIDKIVVKEETTPTMIPVDLTFSAAASKAGVRRASASVVEANGRIFEFHYKGDKPSEVTELKSAEMTGNISLTLKFPSMLSALVPVMQQLEITLPEYMSVADNGSSQTPAVNANTLTFTNVPTTKDLVVKINIHTLDFTKSDATSGNSLSQQGGSVTLDGFVTMSAQGNITGTPTGGGSLGQITGIFASNQFTVNAATGRFNPSIALSSLGEVHISGVPDFLKEGNVVADLYNPQLSLSISNDMQVDGVASGRITAIKDGREIAAVDIDGIRLSGGKTSNICICRKAQGVAAGYDQVIERSNLADLIKTIPDRIAFTASAQADNSKTGRFELGHRYTIQPAYSVDAPLAFAENAVIEYRDTLDGWHDDIEDLKLADDAYLLATANVTSCVPAYLTLSVVPVDADKKRVDGIDVQLLKKDVQASADGIQSATSPLEIRISQTDSQAMKRLDGLLLTVAGKASNGQGNSVTGITLNARKHTLKLTDLKIKMVGKVIGDFN